MRFVAAPVVAALSLLLFVEGSAFAQDRPIVAVFDLEVKGTKLDKGTIDRLTDYLGTLLATRGFQVVPRAQLRERLVQAKKGSYQECFDQSCQIEIGKELAAQKSLSSQVLKIGTQCRLTLNLFDLKKAASEAAGTASGNCGPDDLVASMEQALAGMVGAAVPAEPAPVAAPITEVGERIAAYQRGEREHAYDIGMAYLQGHSGAPQNFTRAREWFAKAAAQGDVAAFVELGERYRLGQGIRENEKEALRWFLKAAEAGDPLGQEKLADLYSDYGGKAVRRNPTEAARWYRQATQSSQRPQPFSALGALLLSGEGVKADRAEALRLFTRAAELGDSTVTCQLALLYETGTEGVPPDPARAVGWLLEGARGGYTPAMFELAKAYADGKLVAVNLVEAYKWLAVYFEKEVDPRQAEELRKQVTARLGPEALARARQEAAAMVEKYVTPQDREEVQYLRTLPGR